MNEIVRWSSFRRRPESRFLEDLLDTGFRRYDVIGVCGTVEGQSPFCFLDYEKLALSDALL